ncbi:mas-related G-protein coupled receptor member X1-like [Gracilinanus agilis]|uniref:mas-related G-protein coupled receptor member X1-like n=1 Tax=Gracilinanus agilis TaxID=191870 RepID=UPI001CFF40B4|nr:mas-related G-protein coupled receptor member X1-like [Gracilinanus agilis]
MAVSTTPEQWKSVHNITEQTNTTLSFDLGAEAHQNFFLFHSIKILSLVIALVGLMGNSLVLWLLSFHIQRSPFSIYILNLAGSDALFVGSCFVSCIWEIDGYLNSLVLVLWICILNLSYCVSLTLLTAISTERCLSVLFPIWYRCHRPKYKSAAVWAMLWALPSLFWGVFVVLAFLGQFYVFYDILYWVWVGWFVFLTCVLCLSSLTLVLKVQCSSQHRWPPRLFLLILLTVLGFLLFGLPFAFTNANGLFLRFPLVPYEFPRLLAYMNSSANPFIYFFLGSQWRGRQREPLRVVLQRALGEEQVERVGPRDTSHPNTLDKLS